MCGGDPQKKKAMSTMSAVRRSSRLASTTPSSVVVVTTTTPIYSYTEPKRRRKTESNNSKSPSPARTTTKSLLTKVANNDFVEEEGSIKSTTTDDDVFTKKTYIEEEISFQQSSPLILETPKKKKKLTFSPVSFDDSPISHGMGSKTPPKSLLSSPPMNNTPSCCLTTPNRLINFNNESSSSLLLSTPKSARRKLFTTDNKETSEKCDLLVSTFSSKSAKSSISGLGTLQRIAEQGKLARLATPVKNSTNFPLPKKFQQLFDIFESMDRIVSIYKQTQKRCVFEEISKNVQKKLNKDFTKEILSQILAVYPNSYNLKLEEHRSFGKKTPGKNHDLVIEPNIKKDLESYWTPPSPQKQQPQTPEKQYGSPIKLASVLKSPRKNNVDFFPVSPRKSPLKATPQLRQLRLDNFDRLDAWRMESRKRIFRYKLLQPVHQLHEEFLNKIGVSKNDVEYGKFHPKFNLESVPDISPAPLPQPSKDSRIQVKIEPFLEKKEEEFVLPSNAEATLIQFKSPEKPTHTPNGKVPLSPKKFAGDTPKLSLYERIMMKQKEREEKMQPLKLAQEHRRGQLELIRETLLFSIWSVFSKIKPKSTIKLEMMIHRIIKDTTLTGGQCIEHVELLCEVSSQFFDLYNAGIHGAKYLRILTQDQEDYQKVKKLINDEIEKCQ